MELRFEWDSRKAAGNVAKHGISFEEASTVFGDPLGRIVGDPRHSEEERRFVLMGRSKAGRFLAVMFTERGESVRLISARRAAGRERKQYEKNRTEDW